MVEDSFEIWLKNSSEPTEGLLEKDSNGKYTDNGMELLKIAFNSGIDWSRNSILKEKEYRIISKETDFYYESVEIGVILYYKNPLNNLKKVAYDLYNNDDFKKGIINFYLSGQDFIFATAKFNPELKINIHNNNLKKEDIY